MSWSVSLNTVKVADLQATIEEAQAIVGDFGKDEMLEQVVAAKRAAIALIESGALGVDEGAAFYFSASGHANPGHAKTPGWADDEIRITVKRVYPA